MIMAHTRRTRILNWLEAEEFILGGLFTPAWNDRAGDHFLKGDIFNGKRNC